MFSRGFGVEGKVTQQYSNVPNPSVHSIQAQAAVSYLNVSIWRGLSSIMDSLSSRRLYS